VAVDDSCSERWIDDFDVAGRTETERSVGNGILSAYYCRIVSRLTELNLMSWLPALLESYLARHRIDWRFSGTILAGMA